MGTWEPQCGWGLECHGEGHRKFLNRKEINLSRTLERILGQEVGRMDWGVVGRREKPEVAGDE